MQHFRKRGSSLDELISDNVGGFKTEKEFTQFLCRQLVAFRRDLQQNSTATALRRLDIIVQNADWYLVLFDDGTSDSTKLHSDPH